MVNMRHREFPGMTISRTLLSLVAFWLACRPVLAAPTQFGGAAGWGGRPEAGPNFLKGEWSYYLTPDNLVLLDTLGDGSGLEVSFKREFLRELAAPGGPLDR